MCIVVTEPTYLPRQVRMFAVEYFFRFLYMFLIILDQQSNHQHHALQLLWDVLVLAAGFSSFGLAYWCADTCFRGFGGRTWLF
jgi:hypothetical protein